MTCNHPLNYRSSHPPVCGEPAVARLRVSISGQLTDLLSCEAHKAKMPPHLDWEKL